MSAQTEVLNLMKWELSRIRTRNSSYSMRAFSRRLGISAAALSEIFAGKRLITKKTAKKFFHNLPISPQISEPLISKLETRSDKNKKLKHRAKLYSPINVNRHPHVWEWHYFAILSLAETAGFRSEPEWIAKRLDISLVKTRKALDRLEKEGMIEWNEKTGWVPTGNQFSTGWGVPNALLRKNHIKSLDLIKKSMKTTPLDLCNFSSMTMAISPKKLAEANLLIQNFRRSLCAFLEEDEKLEVYKISIQLFPLSEPAASESEENLKESPREYKVS